jgi:hypothetical protein
MIITHGPASAGPLVLQRKHVFDCSLRSLRFAIAAALFVVGRGRQGVSALSSSPRRRAKREREIQPEISAGR